MTATDKAQNFGYLFWSSCCQVRIKLQFFVVKIRHGVSKLFDNVTAVKVDRVLTLFSKYHHIQQITREKFPKHFTVL